MTKESPIACDLTALTEGERQRRSEVATGLRSVARSVDELDDGFSIDLGTGDRTWLEAAEFAGFESRCCPFLAFSLEREAEGGTIRLRITGRPGVKEFLRRELLT